MRRIIRMITIFYFSLQLQTVLAMGLGEIKVQNHLNDALKAEVPIVSLDQLDIGQLKAGIASTSEYERLGVVRNPYLTSVEVSIQKNKQGYVYLYAYSDKPVTDPVMDVVLYLTSPQGRFTRHYTLFFDPPGYDSQKEALKPSFPGESPIKSNLLPTVSADAIQQPTATHVKDSNNAKLDRYGPIKPNQTLWNVAAELAANVSGSVPQIAWALYEANPSAFTHDHIGALKEGMYLNIPDRQTILSVDTAKANKAIQNQQGQSIKIIEPSAALNTEPKAKVTTESRPKVSDQLRRASQLSQEQPEIGVDPAVDVVLLQKEVDALEAEVAENQAEITRLREVRSLKVPVPEVVTVSTPKPVFLESPTLKVTKHGELIDSFKHSMPSSQTGEKKSVTAAVLESTPKSTSTSLVPSDPSKEKRIMKANMLLSGLCALLFFIIVIMLFFYHRQRKRCERTQGEYFFEDMVSDNTHDIHEESLDNDLLLKRYRTSGDTTNLPIKHSSLSADNLNPMDVKIDDFHMNDTNEQDFNHEEDLPVEKSVATKLDLARVYIEMEDFDEARSLLEDVISQGDKVQSSSAKQMLDNLP